jgi:hypothetical protein
MDFASILSRDLVLACHEAPPLVVSGSLFGERLSHAMQAAILDRCPTTPSTRGVVCPACAARLRVLELRGVARVRPYEPKNRRALLACRGSGRWRRMPRLMHPTASRSSRCGSLCESRPGARGIAHRLGGGCLRPRADQGAPGGASLRVRQDRRSARSSLAGAIAVALAVAVRRGSWDSVVVHPLVVRALRGRPRSYQNLC